MNYKNLARAAKVFFKEKYEPLLRKNFEGDVRRKEEQISQWEFWYINHFTEGAEWVSEQFEKEKQQWIEKTCEYFVSLIKDGIQLPLSDIDESCIKKIKQAINDKLSELARWKNEMFKDEKEDLYKIIVALWDILDDIDTYAELKINDADENNPFRKICHKTAKRHEFVQSDGYNLFITGIQIDNKTKIMEE